MQIYCASKAAVRSFTDALRKELIATRIRIITVDPGQVLTVRNFISMVAVTTRSLIGVCRSSQSCETAAMRHRQTRSMSKDFDRGRTNSLTLVGDVIH